MYQELLIDVIRDRQARVRADVQALNVHYLIQHPVRHKVGAFMVRMGQRLQSLGGDEVALEAALS